MPAESVQTHVWEHRQTELWDRIFQVTQDVVAISDQIADEHGGSVVKKNMVESSMQVGVELVRANAAEDEDQFHEHLQEARFRAIETDYWLRLAYTLQQQDDTQRDLSGVVTQYSAIIDLLHKLSDHVAKETALAAKQAKGRGSSVK